MLKKNFFILSLLLIFCVMIFSCASTSLENKKSNSTKIKPENYSTFEEEPFYKQNKNLFVEKNLSNGILFIVKKSVHQKNCALSLIIDAEDFSENKKFQKINNQKNNLNFSGLEFITFEMLKKGTKNYSENFLASLEYTDATKFFSKVNVDFFEYGCTLPKENFESIIPIFAETFLTPKMVLEDFQKIVTENQMALSKNYSGLKLLEKSYKVLNEKDSYFLPTFFTDESFIKFDDVKNCHNSFLNSKKIIIVASGNFSDEEIENLFKICDAQFGKIQNKNYKSKKLQNENFTKIDFSKFSKTEFDFSAENFSDNLTDSFQKQNGFLVFNIPQFANKEYLSYGLLSLILDDAFFDYKKNNPAIINDLGNGILLSQKNLGMISLFQFEKNKKSQLLSDVKKIVESENLTRLIQSAKLENYKRVYNSFILSNELRADKTVHQMALSLVYKNDATEYLKFPFYVKSITQEDLQNVAKDIFESGTIFFCE